MRARRGLLCAVLTLTCPALSAQTLGPGFENDYFVIDLGQAPGVPFNYGAVSFKPGDPDTLLLAGDAARPGGAIYEVDLNRDATGHITGLNGISGVFSTAPQIDGGLTFCPTDGVAFFTMFPDNAIGQIKPGSTSPDRVVSLNGLVCASVGGASFVPAGFGGSGRLKVTSYSCGRYYDLTISPDGSGTYDITAATQTAGGLDELEGFTFVPSTYPSFSSDHVLICTPGGTPPPLRNEVYAYSLNATGDPVGSEYRLFLESFTPQGAAVDPAKGDLVFTSFAANRVILVRRTLGDVYCAVNPNSTGSPAMIRALGTDRISDDDFTLMAELVPNQPFIFFHGPSSLQIPFGNGYLCVGAPQVRLSPPSVAAGNRATRIVQLTAKGFVPNAHHFQCWFRDPAAGGTFFNTSNAVRVVLAP